MTVLSLSICWLVDNVVEFLSSIFLRIFSNNYYTYPQIQILYESQHYIVVSKPPDVVMNSNDPNVKVTVQALLEQQFQTIINPSLGHHFYIPHRLDFSTSGVLLVPITKKACAAATKLFSNRDTKKYYIALVRGLLAEDRLDIHFNIGKDLRPEFRNVLMCTGDNEYCLEPKSAETRLLVLERGLYSGYPATKILLRPVSGRRHQLRVHCSHLGHTIVGDYTYSRKRDTRPPRMFLHALRLVLPFSIESLDVSTTDPFPSSCLWQPVRKSHTINTQAYLRLDSQASVIVRSVTYGTS